MPRQGAEVTGRGQYRRAGRRAYAAEHGLQYDLNDASQQSAYKALGLLPSAAGDTRHAPGTDASSAGRALANIRHHGDPAGPPMVGQSSPAAQAIMSGNPGALAALARALQQQG